MGITHQFTSTKSDGGDATLVKPSDWNAGHTITGFKGLPIGTFSRGYTWTSTVESWTITGGTMTSTSNKLHIVTTNTQVALEDSGVSNIANGEVSTELTVTANTGSTGVVFRATDANNFYMLNFEPGQNTNIYKRVSGSFTVIQSFSPRYSPNSLIGFTTLTMLIRFVGSQFEFYIDGNLIGAMLDSTFSTGRLGYYADRSTVDLDNMNIYTL